MRFFRFALALCFTLAVLWLLGASHRVGDKSLPALGAFFNPFSGFWQNAEPAGPPCLSSEITLPGLNGPVRVLYDSLMVPHIFAENLEDAVRVQGYVTAQQRLWQMDLISRKVSGRLSEILGERTLEIDRLSRRRGDVFAAENHLKTWEKSAPDKALLDAFTAGVNAWVAQLSPADYPLEFKLLGYKPEPWTPLKTALVYVSMAETLCSGDNDLGATNALQVFGPQTFDLLYPDWMPGQQPIVPDTGQWAGIRPNLPAAAPANTSAPARPSPGLSAAPAPEPDPYLVGSNNWALAGTRTASGHPLLANDPHLNLTLPSIWFQTQVHTPELNCYGVSLPGVPGVIIGFNEHIAWGITNVGHDVSDWYRIAWADPARQTYLLDGQRRPVTQRVEEIKIKGRAAQVDTVPYTVWGPVVYSHDPKHPLHDCALRWIVHDVPDQNIFRAFFELDKGKSLDDYRQAMTHYNCPAQNFVFAAQSGDIAIQVQGKLPLRRPEQGKFIQDGSQSASGWSGFIPQEHLPALANPSRGFVFSANQHSTPPSYPYYYLSKDFDDYRGRHIFDRLSAMHGATPDSMKTIQLDNFSRRSGDALPLLLRLLDRSRIDAEGKELLTHLDSWNARYDPELVGPTLFESWFDSLYQYTWDEMYRLRARDEMEVITPDSWRLIDLLQRDTANVFFDHPETPVRETARDVVLEAFLAMQKHFHENPGRKTDWAHAKGFALRHMAQIDAFSRLDVLVGGHRNAPNAISKTNGPSWRMIVDLGPVVQALGVFPGGQSGNPGSRYYDNMVDTWAAGRYYPLAFLRKPEDLTGSNLLAQQTFSAK